MNPPIYLSILVILIGSLGWTDCAQGDKEFADEFRRLRKAYEYKPGDRNNKYTLIPSLMAFYEKYADRLRIPPEFRQTADNALKIYKAKVFKEVPDDGLTLPNHWPVVILRNVNIILDVLSMQPDPNQYQKYYVTKSMNQE